MQLKDQRLQTHKLSLFEEQTIQSGAVYCPEYGQPLLNEAVGPGKRSLPVKEKLRLDVISVTDFRK